MSRLAQSLVILVLAATMAGCVSTGSHRGTPEAAVAHRVAQLLDRMEQRDRFSGVVYVVRDGVPIVERACGAADKSCDCPNTLETRFNLGSITKMFTAVAVAQLVESGQIRFDSPVSTYVPEFSTTPKDRVAIHHLLSHTSGIPECVTPALIPNRSAYRNTDDYLPLFVDEPLLFTPGERWAYSNSNYLLLGYIIEKVSGQSYQQYMQTHVFTPAGMASTANEPLDPPAKGRAVSYTHLNPITETETHGWIPATPFNIVESNAAGCTVGSAPDLLRFGQALRNGQLVRQSMAQQLITGTVPVNPGHSDLQYGYGFFDGITNGVRHVGHGGVAYGVSTDFQMLPDLGYTVIVLSNYDPPVAQNLGDRIIKIIVALKNNT